MGIFKSIGKLLWLIVCDIGRIAAAALRGNFALAGDHARHLGIAVHADLLKAVEVVQRVLPLWPRLNSNLDRILIIKLDRIGDMVTTTPVFDALRAAFPRARLDIVGHPLPLALLEGDKRVGELIPYKSWLYHPTPILPGGPALWKLLFKLWWRRYPLVVYLRGSFPFLGLALTSRFAATRFIVAEPVITRYLRAIEPVVGVVTQTRPSLHVDPAAAEFARKLLGSRPDRRMSVAIHAAASAGAKMWPAERFAELADELAKNYDAQVHFLGSPSDRAVLEQIASLCGQQHAYHWTLKLPQVVAVLSAADLFVGNDSGLSHIAAAVGTRTIVIWGPANLSMARPEAPPEQCQILYHDLPCRERCPECFCVNARPYECLTLTQVKDVLQAANRLLGVSRQVDVLEYSNR